MDSNLERSFESCGILLEMTSNDNLVQLMGCASHPYPSHSHPSEDDKVVAPAGRSILKLGSCDRSKHLPFCRDSPRDTSSVATLTKIDMVNTFSFESAEPDDDYILPVFEDVEDEQIEWQPTKRTRIHSTDFQEFHIVSPEEVSRDIIDFPVPNDTDVGIQSMLLNDLPNEVDFQDEIWANLPGSTLENKTARVQFDANSKDSGFLDMLDRIQSTENDVVDHFLLPTTVDGNEESNKVKKVRRQSRKKKSDSLSQKVRRQSRKKKCESVSQSVRTKPIGASKVKADDHVQSDDKTGNPFPGGAENSIVFQTLRDCVPMQDSLKPVVHLLLHIELSQSSREVVKRACRIVKETLKDGRAPLDGRELMGKIFESLVEKLGSLIDLDSVFQASAKELHGGEAYNIFFEPRRIRSEPLVGDGRSVVSSHRPVPSMIQLAIAFGVHHAKNVKQRRMPLQTFLKHASADLESKSNDELVGLWNNLVGLYE